MGFIVATGLIVAGIISLIGSFEEKKHNKKMPWIGLFASVFLLIAGVVLFWWKLSWSFFILISIISMLWGSYGMIKYQEKIIKEKYTTFRFLIFVFFFLITILSVFYLGSLIPIDSVVKFLAF
ncbi:MAG: DUF308 domain-containing protein [Patescibacteria group bacterium]|nr:DUF308 domain-containing protein [Patescibacteria group bacterium]